MLLLESGTVAPPCGAAWFRPSVQVDELPEANEPGLQVSEDGTVGTASEMEKLCDAPLKVAVTVAV